MSKAHEYREETWEDYLPYYCDKRDEIVSAHPGYVFCPYCGSRLSAELIKKLQCQTK